METLAYSLILGSLGYLIQELRQIRKELNTLENELIFIKLSLPKRKTDTLDNQGKSC